MKPPCPIALVSPDKRVLLPPPFEEEFYTIAKEETREHGVKGGLFLIGGAVLLDIVLLPAEILYWIGRVIITEWF